jgi:hypothetical protein
MSMTVQQPTALASPAVHDRWFVSPCVIPVPAAVVDDLYILHCTANPGF